MARARLVRIALAALVAALVTPAAASAELQVKPFLGVSFAASTTLVDPNSGQDSRHLVVGASAVYLGEVFGVEAEVSQISGFFQRGDKGLVVRSGVNTVTGSVIVALPRRLSEYSLRPYAVAGFGLMHARTDTALEGLFDVTSNMGALNLGGGATGFLTQRVGLGWDLRYFRRVSGGPKEAGVTFGNPQLSFWRAYMSIVVR